MMNKIRVLKIQAKYRANALGDKTIPAIRLEGKWLYQLGFRQGLLVKIKQEKHKLILTISH